MRLCGAAPRSPLACPSGRQPKRASSCGASRVLSQLTHLSQPTHELARVQVRRLCRGVCFQPPGLAPQDMEWIPGAGVAGGSASNAEAAVAAPLSSEQQPPARKRRRQKGKPEGNGMRQSTAVNPLDRKAPGKAAAGRAGEPASALTGFVSCCFSPSILHTGPAAQQGNSEGTRAGKETEKVIAGNCSFP